MKALIKLVVVVQHAVKSPLLEVKLERHSKDFVEFVSYQ